ncbi:SAM-dependent MidA family methyltransferase [Sphingomonas zeicaulis]|uniref:class I SAM-dependent methyltransferase n=1 Tax=Sphingomonas zeicaulis TaxID=1632740 RepID=UPI003D22C55F
MSAGSGTSLADRLAQMIDRAGPIPVAQFMAAANTHYYATRDPLGAAGDFTTAPEISQMFGELTGLWLADLWDRAGRPAAHYVELGPGRGTLAVDALRAARAAGLAPPVHLVETSPTLIAAQHSRLPDATWHEGVESLPDDRPLLIVANEFFDALPIRQLMRTAAGWRELLVGRREGRFVPLPGTVPFDSAVPAGLLGAGEGSIVESCPAAVAIIDALARRLAAQGGAMIAIDYGYEGPAAGDTLQALSAHRFADPFEAPGERDLTAHVDFASLATAARRAGVTASGVVSQGGWLEALGIGARSAALGRAQPARAAEIAAARARLTGGEAMGTLFKALALTAPGWPQPAGF